MRIKWARVHTQSLATHSKSPIVPPEVNAELGPIDEVEKQKSVLASVARSTCVRDEVEDVAWKSLDR